MCAYDGKWTLAYLLVYARAMKNRHAVAMAKLGASKGGKARAASLSQERRSEIARNAARARWAVKPLEETPQEKMQDVDPST